jgi:uncharacterized protein YdaU (DUF1376 family)
VSGKTKPASYTWWPADFNADEHVLLMTLEQEGIYRRLLDHQAVHGSIPADIEGLAAVVGKGMTARRLAKVWPGIAPCWYEGDVGRLVNGRLARERRDDEAHRQKKSQAGATGADARWHKDSDRNATAPKVPMANTWPPSPSPSPSERQVSKSLLTPTGERHPEAVLAHAATTTPEPAASSWGMDLPPEMPGLDRRRDSGQGMQAIAAILPRVAPTGDIA